MCIKLLFVLAIAVAFAGTVGRADTPQKTEINHRRRLLTQIGNTMEGSEGGSAFGRSVSISDDGLTVAVGVPGKDGSTGEAFVFALVNDVWEQQGDAIVAATPNPGDDFAFVVALSADGSVAAANSPSANSNTGYVSVFSFSSNAWVEVTNPPLTGDEAGDFFGRSMAMSSDGDVVVSGALGAANDFGQVRVEMGPTSWTQLGDDIDGFHDGSKFGNAVAISSDGETIVVAAEEDNAGCTVGNPLIGQVRVFELSGSTWTQKGNGIPGEAPSDYFGYSVDISADGDVIAAAKYVSNSENYVKVFEWEGANWNQMGNTLTTGVSGDWYGESLSVSGRGRILVVGAPFINGGVTQGQAYLYEYNEIDWELQETLQGDNAFDFFGIDVAITPDGSTFIVGAYTGEVSVDASGIAKVFDTGLQDTPAPTPSPTTSPTQSPPAPTSTTPTPTGATVEPTVATLDEDSHDTGETSSSNGGSPGRINPRRFLTQIGLGLD